VKVEEIEKGLKLGEHGRGVKSSPLSNHTFSCNSPSVRERSLETGRGIFCFSAIIKRSNPPKISSEPISSEHSLN